MQTVKAPLDPWASLTTEELRDGQREYYFNLAPDVASCVGQHAPWSVVATVEPAFGTCSPFPPSVSVKASAGGFGNTYPVTGVQKEAGRFQYRVANNIGTGQFEEPTYLSLLAIISFGATADQAADLSCAKERLVELIMTIDHQPSKRSGG